MRKCDRLSGDKHSWESWAVLDDSVSTFALNFVRDDRGAGALSLPPRDLCGSLSSSEI